ncbi:hypothetical protein [Janibacter indicus]|nr:hypothetical protein [Janibacter indicus]
MAASPDSATAPARRRPWTMIVGGGLVLLAVASWALGMGLLLKEAHDIESLPLQTDTQTVQLEAGESTRVISESEQARCTVEGPGGRETNDGYPTAPIDLGSGDLYRVMAVDAEEGGEYAVECTAGFVLHAQGNAWVPLPIGCALGCVGFVTFVIGLVLWLVRRSGERRPHPLAG